MALCPSVPFVPYFMMQPTMTGVAQPPQLIGPPFLAQSGPQAFLVGPLPPSPSSFTSAEGGASCSSARRRVDSTSTAAGSAGDEESSSLQDVVGKGGGGVEGRVWSLARDQEGCRRVQAALEAATSDSERVAIAAELQGHVWAAAQCRNANHVLQKCVMTMRPEVIQFIIDELSQRGPASTCKVARNQFGCRVLQRLLEHCSPSQVRGLVEDLLTDADRLSTHIYGNYVMRHVLEFGHKDQRARFAAFALERVSKLGSDQRGGCAVLGQALVQCSTEDSAQIARAILGQPGLLPAIAASRHGRVVAEFLVQSSAEPEFSQVRSQLLEASQVLGSARLGRSVLASLQARVARG